MVNYYSTNCELEHEWLKINKNGSKKVKAKLKPAYFYCSSSMTNIKRFQQYQSFIYESLPSILKALRFVNRVKYKFFTADLKLSQSLIRHKLNSAMSFLRDLIF